MKMKTNELIEKVKNLGLETEILINDKEGQTICSITRNRCFQLDIDYTGKDELLEIVLLYSSTPIDER